MKNEVSINWLVAVLCSELEFINNSPLSRFIESFLELNGCLTQIMVFFHRLVGPDGDSQINLLDIGYFVFDELKFCRNLQLLFGHVGHLEGVIGIDIVEDEELDVYFFELFSVFKLQDWKLEFEDSV